MSNLQLRIISALVLAVVVLGLTWLGGLPFRLLSAVIAAAIFYEWCAMSRSPANAVLQVGAGIGLAFVLVALVAGFSAPTVLLLALAAVAVVAIFGVVRGQGAWPATGLAYAALSGVSLAFLRDGDHSGLVAILFLFSVVWATDILAYFTGRALGGPKLAPAISPGKTWSGAIGGAVGGVVAGLIAVSLAGAANLAAFVLIALVLSAISQVGDLFESWIKRRHGVKDSSNLIPGHGGVMDRVDGLVVAAFALYVIGWMASGPGQPAHGLFP